MNDGKLDRFRPSLETLSGVRRQLVEAGIPPEQIPEDWLYTIVAAMTKWSTTSRDGLAFMVNSLGFNWKTGDDDKVYNYIEPNSQQVHEIPPKDVHFFSGASVKGFPVNPNDIEVSSRNLEQCEGCGVTAHCLIDVRDPVSDRIERLCNNCRLLSDNLSINGTGDPSTCNECTMRSCYHNPRKRLRA